MLPLLAVLLAWQPVAAPTQASLRGLRAVSADIIWASGTGGTVIRTLDGGRNWALLPVPRAEKLDFRGLWAWDADRAFVMSSGNADGGLARVYRTKDGGKHWDLVLEQTTAGVFFDAIGFWDRSHGAVLSDPVDGKFLVFLTGDGGRTWNKVTVKALAGEGAFAASNSCLTLLGKKDIWFGTGGAQTARVFHSSDRGRRWSVAETPMHPLNASSGIFSLAFRDRRNGLAVGGDYRRPSGTPKPNAMATHDGGKTWGAIDFGDLYLSSVAYAPETKQAIAAGPKGIVHEAQMSEISVNSLSYPPRGPGWAVGPNGNVLKESVAIGARRVGTSWGPASHK